MPTQRVESDVLSIELTDVTGDHRKISDYSNHQHVVLVLMRGLW
jgi:hypothetical protein